MFGNLFLLLDAFLTAANLEKLKEVKKVQCHNGKNK
ncbi:UNVERIFIED_ORG: hypothetical protein ABIC97_005421 [Peribacillus simplex]